MICGLVVRKAPRGRISTTVLPVAGVEQNELSRQRDGMDERVDLPRSCLSWKCNSTTVTHSVLILRSTLLCRDLALETRSNWMTSTSAPIDDRGLRISVRKPCCSRGRRKVWAPQCHLNIYRTHG
ncbi:hypothetical protein SCLCIDRAFT_304460 [Scleroderma citrinum Foug A]|uniref:Uncharacterized protein n=1 Tax=Scleroderma citrinum Foug A TaxID=1036808 RepID=A0A0C3DGY0_9AGAM|nr:hypothetical protein SCLCIDRAFT_304460 [Scleroderma citrinum Foug A]